MSKSGYRVKKIETFCPIKVQLVKNQTVKFKDDKCHKKTGDNVRPNKELLLNNTNVRGNSDNTRGRGETTMCQFYASDGFMYVPLSTS